MADEPLLLNERTSSPIDMLLAGARILTLITGVVLILVVRFVPEGLVGLGARLGARRARAAS